MFVRLRCELFSLYMDDDVTHKTHDYRISKRIRLCWPDSLARCVSLSLSLFPAILSNKQKYLFLIRFTEYAHQSNAIIIGSSWNSLVPIFIHKQTSMRRNENEETHTFICLMNSPLNIISQREMFAIRVLQIHEFGTNLNVIWLLRNWRNHQLENFYRKYSVNFQH